MELIPRQVRDEAAADLAIKLENIKILRELGEDGAVAPWALSAAEFATKAFQPIAIAYRGLSRILPSHRAPDGLLGVAGAQSLYPETGTKNDAANTGR